MKQAKPVDFKSCKRNHFKLLLFADNRDHMQLFRRVCRHEETKNRFVGCWHVDYDEKKREIVKGQGKKHVHLLLTFPNPRGWSAVCDMLQADRRFCRPVGVHKSKDETCSETLKGGMQYLLHANAPEKGLISGNQLFGAPWLVEKTLQAVSEALAKDVSMQAAVFACSLWIEEQGCKVISAHDLTQFLCNSPYFKAQQSRLLYKLVEEHNQRILRAIAADRAKREAAQRERDWIEHLVPPPEPDYWEEYVL